jgi:hypothetical protein
MLDASMKPAGAGCKDRIDIELFSQLQLVALRRFVSRDKYVTLFLSI